MNPKPLTDIQQMAALMQLANRQRFQEQQIQTQTIAKAVQEALKA